MKLRKYPKSTVNAVVKRYKKTKEDVRTAHKPKLDKILPPWFVAGQKRSIKSRPNTSMKKVAEASCVEVLLR